MFLSNQSGDKESDAPDINIENIPISTMKKDIEQIKKTGTVQYAAPLEKTVRRNESTGVPSSSPFFTPDISSTRVEKEFSIEPQPKIIFKSKPAAEPVLQPQGPGEAQNDYSQLDNKPLTIKGTREEVKPAWGKVLFISIFIFIVLASAGGGYYFWITRNKKVSAPAPSVSDAIQEKSQESAIQFSENNPNYLNIDPEATDYVSFRIKLTKYGNEVVKSGTRVPIEFIVRSMQNEEVPFATFAEKLNLKIPASILALLGDDYSIFFINDSGQPRIGLTISSKNDADLKSALAQEEASLPGELTPIFLAADYTLEQKAFSASNYNGTEIRYLNITSPENLSVDYSLFKSQLIIGTSKMTLRNIIDHLEKTP